MEYAAKISADGSKVLIYSSHLDGAWLWQPMYFALWDVATGQIYKTPSPETLYEGRRDMDFDRSVSAFALCQDGYYALVGLKNGELRFCDLANNEVFSPPSAHRNLVTDIALSANECWAVSCSLDRTVKVWHVPTKNLVASFTSDHAFYKCQIQEDEEEFIIITSDATKDEFFLRLNVSQASPPSSADSVVSSVSDDKPKALAGHAHESLLFPEVLQIRIGIPLPLHLLHTLPGSLDSEVGIDYQPLKTLLEAESWNAANQETASLMLRVLRAQAESNGAVSADLTITPELLQEFPAVDLLTIDRLWLKYSNGRYGFSLQMRVWGAFRGSFRDFLTLIGHQQQSTQCEPLEQRRGYYPYFMLHSYPDCTKALFVRFAECIDYFPIERPEHRESETPNLLSRIPPVPIPHVPTVAEHIVSRDNSIEERRSMFSRFSESSIST